MKKLLTLSLLLAVFIFTNCVQTPVEVDDSDDTDTETKTYTPIFWDKSDKLIKSWKDPEIGDDSAYYAEDNSEDNSGINLFTGGKFGNCIQLELDKNEDKTFYPLGDNKVLSKGTISFHLYMRNYNSTKHEPEFFLNLGTDTYIALAYSSSTKTWNNRISVDSTIECNDNTPIGHFDNPEVYTYYHVYIIWDQDSTLADSKSIRVFVDGVEIMSTNKSFTSDAFNFYFINNEIASTNSNTVHFIYDNIKIWDKVVSESPSFEYNNGAGREDGVYTYEVEK